MSTPPDVPPPDAPPSRRRRHKPNLSEGPLSSNFPEVEVSISSSFAHDRGMISGVDALTVGGEPCTRGELLQKLVALRGGWTRQGGSSDEEILATFKRFIEDWDAIFPYSGRLTSQESPQHLRTPLGDSGYHPPRVALYDLDDGSRIVVHSYFYSWDGGNHGRQYAVKVEAYRVTDGVSYKLEERQHPRAPGTSTPPDPANPQPVDPAIPHPRRISYY